MKTLSNLLATLILSSTIALLLSLSAGCEPESNQLFFENESAAAACAAMPDNTGGLCSTKVVMSGHFDGKCVNPLLTKKDYTKRMKPLVLDIVSPEHDIPDVVVSMINLMDYSVLRQRLKLDIPVRMTFYYDCSTYESARIACERLTQANKKMVDKFMNSLEPQFRAMCTRAGGAPEIKSTKYTSSCL